MSVLLPVFFFALGAIVASFVGVLVVRMHTGQSFLTGRSKCDACNTVLSPWVLMPVFPYLMSRGRAACCGVRITPFTVVTEVLLGGLFTLAYLKLGLSPALFAFLAALSLILALVLYDLSHQILPPALLVPFVAVAVATDFLAVTRAQFLQDAVAALVLGGILALIHYASRGRAMGFADAPFAFGCALLVSAAAVPGFLFSFWIGAVIGIIVLLRRPRGSRMGVEVPFAPFLAAGFLLAYFTAWNPLALTAAFL